MGHAFYFAMALLLGFSICASIVGIIAPVSFNRYATWSLWQAWYNNSSIDPNKILDACSLNSSRVVSVLTVVMTVAASLFVGLRFDGYNAIWTVFSLLSVIGLAVASAVTTAQFQDCIATKILPSVNPLGPLWDPPGPAMVGYIVTASIGFVCLVALGAHACWTMMADEEQAQELKAKQEKELEQQQLQAQQLQQQQRQAQQRRQHQEQRDAEAAARKAAEEAPRGVQIGDLFAAKQQGQQQQQRRDQFDQYHDPRAGAFGRGGNDDDGLLPLQGEDSSDDEGNDYPTMRQAAAARGGRQGPPPPQVVSAARLPLAARDMQRAGSRRGGDLAVDPFALPAEPPQRETFPPLQLPQDGGAGRRPSRLQQVVDGSPSSNDDGLLSMSARERQNYEGRNPQQAVAAASQQQQGRYSNPRGSSSPRRASEVPEDPFAPFAQQQRYDQRYSR